MTDREDGDRRWCGGAPVLASEVLGDWIELLRACRPWSDMPLDDLAGDFHVVLDELLEPRGSLAPEPRADRLRRAARAHGAFRRRQGCPALVLREEVAAAEDAIEIALERSGAAPPVIIVIQDSLRAVLRSIERASYGGYVDSTDHAEQP